MHRRKASRASALLQMVFAIMVLAFSVVAPAAEPPRRILFIGNSLTYVNNLPSATASLAPPDVAVDAFAVPGASLVDDEHNPRVAELLAKGHYTDVVFQERGGDVVCTGAGCYDGAEFKNTERASKALADMARAGGAHVYYLGTWQVNPAMEPVLVEGERRIAHLMAARYIEIGQTWSGLRQASPAGAWLHSDGQHPGHATTALMAIRVWQAITGEHATRAPCVGGTLYYHAPSEDGFFHVDRGAQPVTCLVDAPTADGFAKLP